MFRNSEYDIPEHKISAQVRFFNEKMWGGGFHFKEVPKRRDLGINIESLFSRYCQSEELLQHRKDFTKIYIYIKG